MLAFAAGVGPAPWSDVMRSLWNDLLPADVLPSAFALDAALMEVNWIVWPLLVGVATALLSPQVALLACAAIAFTGAIGFLTAPQLRGWAHEHREDFHPLGALRSPGVRTIALATIPIGIGSGTLETAVAQFSSDAGQIGAAGALISAWSLSSAIVGFEMGRRSLSMPVARQWLLILLVGPIGTVPVLIGGSIPMMAVLVFVAGGFFAPMIASGGQLLRDLAPPGMRTESFGWGFTSLLVGSSLGNLIGGSLADHQGWRFSILASILAGVLATAIGFLGRRTLRPHSFRSKEGHASGEPDAYASGCPGK